MMCRICGYDLNKIDSNNCVDSCASCGQCGKQENKNMIKCPNCGYVNYIENNEISIFKSIKEKLNI